MDYSTQYNNLIDNAKSRGLVKSKLDFYTEYHHIKPQSMFPELADDPENGVLLKAKEHFLAHFYLWKIYENLSMKAAFWGMWNKGSKLPSRKEEYNEAMLELDSDEYSKLREAFSLDMSKWYKENPELASEARKKTAKTLGKEGCKARTKKALQTMGEEGIKARALKVSKAAMRKSQEERRVGIKAQKAKLGHDGIVAASKKMWSKRTQEQKTTIAKKIAKTIGFEGCSERAKKAYKNFISKGGIPNRTGKSQYTDGSRVLFFIKGEQPENWIPVRRSKYSGRIHKYTNGTEFGCFIENKQPEGWKLLRGKNATNS